MYNNFVFIGYAIYIFFQIEWKKLSQFQFSTVEGTCTEDTGIQVNLEIVEKFLENMFVSHGLDVFFVFISIYFIFPSSPCSL